MSQVFFRLFFFFTLISLLIGAAGCARTGPQVTQGEVDTATEILRKKAKVFEFQQDTHLIEIGLRILAQVPEPIEVKFFRADCDEINAGAIPSIIAVCQGMSRFLRSDDELASVLGHEMAHLTRGHHGKASLMDLSSLILGMMAESAAPGSGQVVAGLVRRTLTVFDRDQEREADYYGLLYAYRAGFNPEAGAAVWERFAVELPESTTKSLFSTHPISPERMVRAKKLAKELKEGSLAPEEVLETGSTERRNPVLFGLQMRPIPELLADLSKEAGQWQIWGVMRSGEKGVESIRVKTTLIKDTEVLQEKDRTIDVGLPPFSTKTFSFTEYGVSPSVTSLNIVLKEINEVSIVGRE